MTGQRQKFRTRKYEQIFEGEDHTSPSSSTNTHSSPQEQEQESELDLEELVSAIDTLIQHGIVDREPGSQLQNQILNHLDSQVHQKPPTTRPHVGNDGHTRVVR